MERFRHSHYIFFVEVNIEILTDWTKEVFLPQAKVGSHALFDMWGGWKKPLTGEHVTEKELQIHYVPGMQYLLWRFYNTSYSRGSYWQDSAPGRLLQSAIQGRSSHSLQSDQTPER